MMTVSEARKCVQGSRSRRPIIADVVRGGVTLGSRSLGVLAIALIVGLGATPARAGFNIPIPNGDFTMTANDGSIGGGILGGSGSGTIGSGPWGGTYTGVVSLLAPPVLTISPGFATISGIAGAGVLSVVDNSGDFTQTLTGVNYLGNTTYTLVADVNVGSLLSLGVLNSSGVGVGLTSNGTLLSGGNGGSSPTIALSLLSGNTYQVSATYLTSNIAPTGPIGIELYDAPTNLATANLFSSVSFSNVSLSYAVPEPSSIAMMGLGVLLTGAYGVRRNRRKSLEIIRSENVA